MVRNNEPAGDVDEGIQVAIKPRAGYGIALQSPFLQVRDIPEMQLNGTLRCWELPVVEQLAVPSHFVATLADCLLALSSAALPR